MTEQQEQQIISVEELLIERNRRASKRPKGFQMLERRDGEPYSLIGGAGQFNKIFGDPRQPQRRPATIAEISVSQEDLRGHSVLEYAQALGGMAVERTQYGLRGCMIVDAAMVDLPEETDTEAKRHNEQAVAAEIGRFGERMKRAGEVGLVLVVESEAAAQPLSGLIRGAIEAVVEHDNIYAAAIERETLAAVIEISETVLAPAESANQFETASLAALR